MWRYHWVSWTSTAPCLVSGNSEMQKWIFPSFSIPLKWCNLCNQSPSLVPSPHSLSKHRGFQEEAQGDWNLVFLPKIIPTWAERSWRCHTATATLSLQCSFYRVPRGAEKLSLGLPSINNHRIIKVGSVSANINFAELNNKILFLVSSTWCCFQLFLDLGFVMIGISKLWTGWNLQNYRILLLLVGWLCCDPTFPPPGAPEQVSVPVLHSGFIGTDASLECIRNFLHFCEFSC